MADSGFSLSTTRTWLVGLIVAALSGAAIALAVALLRGTAETIVVNVGSTTLSIGLITVVYDVFIRKSFTRELLRMVRLQQRLADAGIQEIAEESLVEWRRILSEGTNFCLILIDASAWGERDWQHVLAASRKRQTNVEIYLPDSESENFPALAGHMGLDPESFSGIVTRVADQFENSWKTARQTSPSLDDDATLNIFGYQGISSYSLYIVDDEAVVVLPQALGRAPGSTGAAFRFTLNDRDMPSRWIMNQRNQARNQEKAILYAND